MSRRPDVVVIGAGIVGAACAYHAAAAGLAVTVLDRGPLAGGTTGAGEGNILLSDKKPGPELDLALLSHRLWRTLDVGDVELVPKGGLVVAASPTALSALRDLGERQRPAGVDITAVAAGELRTVEPELADGLAGGAYYPQDLQVQPMLATARMLRGLDVRCGVTVTGIRSTGGRVTGVETSAGFIASGAVVNAAGTWAGEIAELAGVDLPVLPRRGFVLVTGPLPGTPIRHKVYAAEYVADVGSDSADLQSSAVVEGTPAGTVLIGASRERVGFDRAFRLDVLRRLAAQAVALFPFLGGVRAIRAYRGFRPYCPDHVPVIGPDPRRPGLYHACGHEGAGIGLAPATGHLIATALTGATPPLDLHPYRPERFT